MSAGTNLNRSQHSAFPADVLAVALAGRRSRRKIETEQLRPVGGGRSSGERQPPGATCSLCLRRSVDDRDPRLKPPTPTPDLLDIRLQLLLYRCSLPRQRESIRIRGSSAWTAQFRRACFTKSLQQGGGRRARYKDKAIGGGI
jgi:hypothetical protein